jgi:hypothetical protein
VRLKDFPGLGMDVNSDKFLLPDHYTTVQPQPFYRGEGMHSVKELEKLCKDFQEYAHQQAVIKQRLIKEIKTT